MSQSLTYHRDLRTGRTIWMARRRLPIPVARLTKNARCDVVVIGAGISGAIIAENLTDAGLQVIILDRRGVIEGSTAASTALLQYEIDTPLTALRDTIGRDKAERIWRRSKLAVDALRERTERWGISADAATRNALYLNGNVLDAGGLEREAAARRAIGLEATVLQPSELEAHCGIRNRHALLSSGNYAADPRQLAAGFLNKAIERGAAVYTPVDVQHLSPHANGVTVFTEDGPEIDAQQVILATGYEMIKGVPRKHNRITSSWVIATRPQRRALWPDQSMIWEAATPYLYIRTTPQGAIICGGEDEDIADARERDAKIPAKARVLSEKLSALLPGIDATPVFAWAGSFGDNPLGIPTVGRIPRMPGCYAAMGYGGNGITFSMMAGQMLRALIMGERDADADLFSFYRTY